MWDFGPGLEKWSTYGEAQGSLFPVASPVRGWGPELLGPADPGEHMARLQSLRPFPIESGDSVLRWAAWLDQMHRCTDAPMSCGPEGKNASVGLMGSGWRNEEHAGRRIPVHIDSQRHLAPDCDQESAKPPGKSCCCHWGTTKDGILSNRRRDSRRILELSWLGVEKLFAFECFTGNGL